MNSHEIQRSIAALAALLICAHAAIAQQTSNHLLRAVPAPQTVTIDGKLDDWDRSGGIFCCYEADTLRETHSAQVWMMYDAEALYVAIHFKDATPMVNHINPKHQPSEGWRSDCIQMRMKTDRLLHLDCHYFTDEKRPGCYLLYQDFSKRAAGFEGKLDEAIGNGVEAAFRSNDDGKGYVQEMRIAWRLLRRDGMAYRAGESFRCGLEFFWGDPSGERWPAHRFADLINREKPMREFFWMDSNAWGEVRLMERGNLAPEKPAEAMQPADQLEAMRYSTSGPVELNYALPENASVTLVVEKPDGTRVRNLIADVPRKPGRNTDRWDGADDAGRLVPAGEYRFRGLWHKPFDVRYEFAYGTPADPPWETADGRGAWVPDHVPAMTVLADAQRVYAAAAMSEGGNTLIALDGDGRKRWGVARIYGGPLARHGDYLYMIAGGQHPAFTRPGEIWLQRFDPTTGKFVSFPGGKSERVVATYPDDRPVKPRETEGVSVAQKLYDAEWCHCDIMGMAAAGNRLYVSLFYENKILALDPATGEKTGEFSLERPAGLAADARGTLYAISATQVVRLDAQGRATPVVREKLEAPVGLACDAAGNLYVSDWRGAMCVKVFSPDGKFLRAIGRVGGRPLSGRYDPGGMFRPWGISVDAQNRLWVAEYDYSPKRISVWSANGELVREYCGATWYAGTECAVNPLNPRQAFSMGNVLELDWPAGRWRINGTLWRPTHPDAWLGPRGEGMVLETLKLNGRDLLVGSRSYGFFCVSELHSDHAKPLMALGRITQFVGEGRFPDFVAQRLWDDPKRLEWAKKKYPALFNGVGHHRHRLLSEMASESERSKQPMRTEFIWTDGNGDGLVQPSEIQFFNTNETGGVDFRCGWRFAHGPDLTLYPAVTRDRKTTVWRLPVRSWNSIGAPVYDASDAKLIHSAPPKYFLNSAWSDQRGNVLLNQDPMQMIAPDGRLLWTFPNTWPGVHGSHSAPQDRRGLLIGPLKVIGSATLDVGEVFCLSGNMGKAFLMTTDGLFLGSLFRDCRSAPDSMPNEPVRGVSLMQTSAGGEWFGGEFFRSAADGKIHIGSDQAREGVLLSEVTGLETARRIEPKPVAFNAAQYAAAEKLLAERTAVDATQRVATLARLDKAPPLKGSGAGFDWPRATKWDFDGSHRADAALGFDDENLYAAFRVTDDSPMINGGKDWKQLFKTGDAAVVELGVGERGQSNATKWLPGDLRLLLSVMDGKPVAVLYRYRVPGAKAPVAFSSPVTTVQVDEVSAVEQARVNVQRKEDGYTIEAAVPLAALGWQPRAGQLLRGDFGVVYSDKAGLKNELRMYWSNKATGIVSDLPSEAGIRPELWGMVEVK